VLSYALAYWAAFSAIHMLGVSQASIITSAWPVASVLVGLLMFREKLNLLKLAGMILLIAGAALAML